MMDEAENKYQDYHSLPQEEWCEILSTLADRHEIKRAAELIRKQISLSFKSIQKSYDSEGIHRVPRKKKKSRTSKKPHHEATYKH